MICNQLLNLDEVINAFKDVSISRNKYLSYEVIVHKKEIGITFL